MIQHSCIVTMHGRALRNTSMFLPNSTNCDGSAGVTDSSHRPAGIRARRGMCLTARDGAGRRTARICRPPNYLDYALRRKQLLEDIGQVITEPTAAWRSTTRQVGAANSSSAMLQSLVIAGGSAQDYCSKTSYGRTYSATHYGAIAFFDLPDQQQHRAILKGLMGTYRSQYRSVMS